MESSEAEPKVIKVVDIFNDRELALNAGTDAGLAEGTTLRIVASKPQKITDLDTGELLGEIVRTKAVVRVYEVQERFALARTFRSRSVNVGGQGTIGASVLGRIFEAPRYETRVETLRRAEGSAKPLSADESVVSLGDVAEVIDSAEVDDVPSSTVWR